MSEAYWSGSGTEGLRKRNLIRINSPKKPLKIRETSAGQLMEGLLRIVR
jgi:hypothetical protein